MTKDKKMRIKMLKDDEYRHAPAVVTAFKDGWEGATTRVMGEALIKSGSAEEVKSKRAKAKKSDDSAATAQDADVKADDGDRS